MQCLSAETCLKSFFIHPVKHSREFFNIQCSSSGKCFKCFFVYTGSKTPSSLSLSNVSVMQHVFGFLHSLKSSRRVVSHYPVFQGCSMLPELLFLSGSNIPSSLSPSTFEFCEMYHVLLVHPKWSTLNRLSPSSVSCWSQGSDTSPCTLGHTHPVVYHLLFQVFDMHQLLLVHPGSNTPVV